MVRNSVYEIFAGWCAVLAGVFAFLYAIAALLVAPASPALGAGIASAILFLVGLLSTALFTGLFERLRRGPGAAFALWGFVLGFAASFQMMIVGTGELAALVRAPSGQTAPFSPLSPSIALAYGIFAAAVIVLSVVVLVGRRLPPIVGYIGFVAAGFLIVVFFTGLLIAPTTSLLLMAPFILNGFLILPMWYLWTGISLWNPPSPVPRYLARQAEA